MKIKEKVKLPILKETQNCADYISLENIGFNKAVILIGEIDIPDSIIDHDFNILHNIPKRKSKK